MTLKNLRSSYKIYFITADLSTRFGFRENENCLSVALSEQASVGFSIALPESNLMIVGTDDKYPCNSMDVVVDAIKQRTNVHVIATPVKIGRVRHTTPPCLFAVALEQDVFELVGPDDL